MDLPKGWTSALSRSQSRTYFHNRELGVSVWSIDEMKAIEAKRAGKSKAEEDVFKGDLRDLDGFREYVVKKVAKFLATEGKTELQFERCSKERRYLIYEAADDEDLKTETVHQEGRDAYVVMYKPGFHPKELDQKKLEELRKSQPEEVVQRPVKRQKKEDEAIPLTGEVKQLGGVKRDRRTIEEIQKDLKQKNKPE
mmetsp:Transcript_15887/g.25941  ORF Transcript_15887/g.25941 Transcript_15887/m.25941 type:complete len:196 (-) Transcript_15887:772-1359(-)